MTAEIRAAVAAERRDQAELLSGLTEEQWNAPSLCEGWTVKHVVAHTTLPFRSSGKRVLWEMLKSAGRFNHASDRMARKDAQLPTSDLLDALKSNIDHPWTPPGSGPAGALSHDVIHGLDITTALGIDREVPHERLKFVLDGMKPSNVKYFGADLDGKRLEATDMDWTFGEGKPVRGLAQDLLLLVCGRTLPQGRLS
ncbi:maleylpyruvate isomerase family mycothiol-dependent enzyme [Lentzea sp. BCCO 10_0061]|uniref:Maleylpyruvate isomerase family mycothiol-dependent enzyme n=1 Tax=Lentzea sokolovensis TaxID=3095429 RepID=A0ABU4V8F7_9PSEU|nr:maleylpyruvate isomerase family mycothiol-dependent enzyme [Lentzea sp. BCCO 10_0061]MDX8147765.1 maleylpyruvate isomerase family mycothiol-dependent enzyme [Lentzea sp. BCCO 10_0061]